MKGKIFVITVFIQCMFYTAFTQVPRLVKSFTQAGSFIGNLPFIELNGETYFSAQTPLLGLELWKTNATATGTINVADIGAGNTSGLNGNSSSNFALCSNGKLVFAGLMH